MWREKVRMKFVHKTHITITALIAFLMFTIGFACSCSEFLRCSAQQPIRPIKVVVVTGGHGFEHEPFFAIFQQCEGINYVEARQQDHSEIFEDISEWDYDVIVLYNMTQNISPQRQANFTKLLKRGVGLLALHHSVGAFQQWDEYRKIIGSKYLLKAEEIDDVNCPASSYKHGANLKVHVEDRRHPITQALSDFAIQDETYKDCWFARDNHVLLSTDHPDNDKMLAWVRKYGKARVCYIQLGHGPEAYANPNYRQLVARAIKWCAGRL
jgi:type 1 glutamine amidotransferase